MKAKITYVFVMVAFLATVHQAPAQGTAFTYQGQLLKNGIPANGSYDLQFVLFTTNQFGSPVTPILTNAAVPVNNGLFTTTLDFGAGVFTGTNYWLDISVRTNGGSGFTTLAPRQFLMPTPYAIFANTASNVLGTVPSGGLSGNYDSAVTLDNPGNNISGTFTGDGTSVANVNALTLNGLTSAAFWNTTGNAGANPTNGTFLGTTDNLPLELKVNGARALRLEYAIDPRGALTGITPNVVGGCSGNVVSNGVYGALIAGGGNPGFPNWVGGDYASVLGGFNNKALGNNSVVMGDNCTASGGVSTAMGIGCVAGGDFSLAAGSDANASHNGSFVWGDSSSTTLFSDTSVNQFLIRASGGVGIGTASTPPGGLNVASGGVAVTGTSSPNYPGAKGVFIESEGTFGAMFAFDYTGSHTLPLCLNTPGGNVGIGTTTPNYKLTVAGTCEATTFVTSSDRNVKEHFQAVDAAAVLDKVAALPVTRWNYKEDKANEHIGPMAQDFYAAFNVGPDNRHITTTDEGGVALAAIQGLNQKLEETRAENAELKHQNDLLAERLNELEATVKQFAAGK
jgi:hypothetical protein